jgi:hypothetical protein
MIIIEPTKKTIGNVNCEKVLRKSNRKGLAMTLSSSNSAKEVEGEKVSSGSKANHAKNVVTETIDIKINDIFI